MPSLDTASAIKGFMAAKKVPQKALAIALECNPSNITRKFEGVDDPWEAFLLGFAAGEAATKCAIRNERGQMVEFDAA